MSSAATPKDRPAHKQLKGASKDSERIKKPAGPRDSL